jgi:hypothetical protein
MVTFLQRTFTSLVHPHAGRTQAKSAGILLAGLRPNTLIKSPAWGVKPHKEYRMRIILPLLLLLTAMQSIAVSCVSEGETVYKVKFSVSENEDCVVMKCQVPPDNVIKSVAQCETVHKDFLVCGWNPRKKAEEINIKLEDNGYYIINKKQCKI